MLGRFNNPHKYTELTFEVTQDEALLQQYRKIYEQEFRAVHKAHSYRDKVDEHDHRAHFLIIRQDNFCIGGVRLSTKGPHNQNPLPVESRNFRVEHYFPELAQNEMTYGQVGRICLLPDFRGGDVTRELFWHIHNNAVALGWTIGFATAPIVNARINRQMWRQVTGQQIKIHFDIDVPPYSMCEEIKMYFMSFGINKKPAI